MTQKGYKQTEEHKNKRIKKHSEETKRKISEGNKGKIYVQVVILKFI